MAQIQQQHHLVTTVLNVCTMNVAFLTIPVHTVVQMVDSVNTVNTPAILDAREECVTMMESAAGGVPMEPMVPFVTWNVPWDAAKADVICTDAGTNVIAMI